MSVGKRDFLTDHSRHFSSSKETEPHCCEHLIGMFKTFVVTISCRTDLEATVHVYTFLSIRIVGPTKETAHVF
jgi:hypothetical protein